MSLPICLRHTCEYRIHAYPMKPPNFDDWWSKFAVPGARGRKPREGAGLVINPADVELAHVAHVVDALGALPLMQLVFKARRWEGEPKVLETDKCLDWQWWPRHELPDRIVPYTRTAIAAIAQGRPYSQLGW